MIITKKKKDACVNEAVKHLELNLIERNQKNVRFRTIKDIDDFQQGFELLVEYNKFYYKGNVNTLLIPLKKDLIDNDEVLVNYIYNAIYFGIYKTFNNYEKVTVHYHVSYERNGFISIHFLVITNDENVYLLKNQESTYYSVVEKPLKIK